MYEYWFASIQQLSHKTKSYLRKNVEDIKDIYQVSHLKKYPFLSISDREMYIIEETHKNWDIRKEFEKAQEKQVQFVTICDKEYPNRLRAYEDAPYALFYKGKLPKEDQKTMAIIGARRCSTYGEQYGIEYGKVLGKHGIQVISGMAHGIDGLAQRAALDGGGTSFAVLGCGVDICYPRENIGLYRDLCIKGGIISEQPLGTPPLPAYFPQRNRIISGLSDVILIMEAKMRSGSLITADQALEQGKEIYALPGRVDSELSKGCNGLIKQGAGILGVSAEFLSEMGIQLQENKSELIVNKITLDCKEKLVYSVLDSNPQHISWIEEQTKVPIHELMSLLVSLELKAYIREYSKNYYAKII